MSSIEVYPNPARDQLTIEQLDAVEMNIQIVTLSGQVVGSHLNTGITSQINIDNLEAGAYLLEIRVGERLETRRFVKQ